MKIAILTTETLMTGRSVLRMEIIDGWYYYIWIWVASKLDLNHGFFTLERRGGTQLVYVHTCVVRVEARRLYLPRLGSPWTRARTCGVKAETQSLHFKRIVTRKETFVAPAEILSRHHQINLSSQDECPYLHREGVTWILHTPRYLHSVQNNWPGNEVLLLPSFKFCQ